MKQGSTERIGRLFGTNATKLLTEYRRSRPDASPSEVAVAIESAAFAGAGAIAIAERKAAQGRAPVFMYTLTDHINAPVPGTNYQVGAAHAMDIRLKFDNLAPAESRIRSLTEEESADHALAARNMSQMWASFAHTGQPRAPEQPAWPAYDLKTARDDDDRRAMPRCQRSLSKRAQGLGGNCLTLLASTGLSSGFCKSGLSVCKSPHLRDIV